MEPNSTNKLSGKVESIRIMIMRYGIYGRKRLVSKHWSVKFVPQEVRQPAAVWSEL
jgi:hypothetical protein